MVLNNEVKSVKELTNEIKSTLENAFPYVWVKGELGSVKLHSSGHRYFSLKEDDCVINGICWRGTALSIEMAEGKIVECYAKVTIFGGRSSYQIVAKEIREVSSKGDIFLNLEKLKKQLLEEGIFSLKNESALPKFPKVIGILTSPTGAVLHDMMHRINDRFPCVEIKFFPVNVQGADSKKSILEALSKVELIQEIDVVILARGGGSLEDLWIFNDEDIVRKVAALQKPIITAIGHETDTTLVDYGSNLRAPTPTAAIEFCVPDKSDLIKDLMMIINTSLMYSLEKLSNIQKFLDQFADSDTMIEGVIESFYQKIDAFLCNFDAILIQKLQKIELFLAEFDMNLLNNQIEKVQFEIDYLYKLSFNTMTMRLEQSYKLIEKQDEYLQEKDKELKEKVFVFSEDGVNIISAESLKKLNKTPFNLAFMDGSVSVVEK